MAIYISGSVELGSGAGAIELPGELGADGTGECWMRERRHG
jgi:hypothetical protein